MFSVFVVPSIGEFRFQARILACFWIWKFSLLNKGLVHFSYSCPYVCYSVVALRFVIYLHMNRKLLEGETQMDNKKLRAQGSMAFMKEILIVDPTPWLV
ncbi:hypothetical protein L2E82_41977 [Cichorium intybus]|uniref:Uncharacterized protein n=1 Tax=Cichorium intybus TaxID=13427 RepID=A0ACB8ZL55_CICIN|nr:hypothetical protein L2E82_41977 [Cichorium intybus]